MGMQAIASQSIVPGEGLGVSGFQCFLGFQGFLGFRGLGFRGLGFQGFFGVRVSSLGLRNFQACPWARPCGLPIVSIVVPFFGLTKLRYRVRTIILANEKRNYNGDHRQSC